MKTLTVYDPAMCCSTGICGVDIDQLLVNFAADLDWLKSEGVDVTRYNLSSEPAVFAENEQVKSVLQDTGVEGLPVIIVGDEMKSSGTYPNRSELAQMAGVSTAGLESSAIVTNAGCCGDDSISERSGCC